MLDLQRQHSYTNFSPHNLLKQRIYPNALCAQCIITLGVRLATFDSISLDYLLTHLFWEQAFSAAISPQRVTSRSTCLKGILVIPDSKTFYS